MIQMKVHSSSSFVPGTSAAMADANGEELYDDAIVQGGVAEEVYDDAVANNQGTEEELYDDGCATVNASSTSAGSQISTQASSASSNISNNNNTNNTITTGSSIRDRLAQFQLKQPVVAPLGKPPPVMVKKPTLPTKPANVMNSQTSNSLSSSSLRPETHAKPKPVTPVKPSTVRQPVIPALNGSEVINGLKGLRPLGLKPTAATPAPAIPTNTPDISSTKPTMPFIEPAVISPVRACKPIKTSTGLKFYKNEFTAKPILKKPTSLDTADLPSLQYDVELRSTSGRGDDRVSSIQSYTEEDELNELKELNGQAAPPSLPQRSMTVHGPPPILPPHPTSIGNHEEDISEEEGEMIYEPIAADVGAAPAAPELPPPVDLKKLEKEKKKREDEEKKRQQEAKKQKEKEEKARQKEQQEQDKLTKKYKVTDEETQTSHLLKMKKDVSCKGSSVTAVKGESVFLVRKLDNGKQMIIKNRNGLLGVVDAASVDDLDEQSAVQADGFPGDPQGEEIYEQI